MRKIFLLLKIFILFTSVHAADWHEYWTQGLQLSDAKDFFAAEEAFNLAVKSLEDSHDNEHLYVYIDRARIKLALGKNEEALLDLNKALSSASLSNDDKIDGFVSRWITYARLGMEKECNEDLHSFGKIYPNMPTIESTKDKIIIRNAPTNCPCFKKLMTCYYIHSGICDNKEDIIMTRNGVCIINRLGNCGCDECIERSMKSRTCGECGYLIKPFEPIKNDQSGRRSWCDRAAVAGGTWCGNAFKTKLCSASCALAVYQLQQGCYWCCDGAGFYKNCIKPFEDICSAMDIARCDPYFD